MSLLPDRSKSALLVMDYQAAVVDMVEAADLDYRLVVLRDACLDRDPEVHACLMDKVFPRQAEVLGVEGFEAELQKPRP